MEKIKVVYSWLGPRGPIWNTELPNILSFSDASEHAQVNSHRWWNDDNWTALFSKDKDNYEIYPACSIELEDERPFIFPMSLTWRVNFESYFLGNTGIIEFSHMPMHLVRLLREQRGYILINLSCEAFMHDSHLAAMHSYFQGVHGIPLHKIIYLTGCINAQELYDNYCNTRGIPNDKNNRLTIVSYPSSQVIFRPNIEHAEDEPMYDENALPEKLFLMWNRRYRSHRIVTALILESLNLVDRSYISFSDVEIEKPDIRFVNSIPHRYLAPFNDIVTPEVIKRFNNKLPLVLDGETNINQMCEDRGNQSRPYYQNSLVSIITETNFDSNEVTLTEKSYKPIKEKHPFIIVGAKGALKGIHDAGFKTFSEFWDESYDTIADPNLRMAALKNAIDQIGQWDQNKILDFKRRVKPILEHNFNMLKKSSAKNTVSKLANIIRGS